MLLLTLQEIARRQDHIRQRERDGSLHGEETLLQTLIQIEDILDAHHTFPILGQFCRQIGIGDDAEAGIGLDHADQLTHIPEDRFADLLGQVGSLDPFTERNEIFLTVIERIPEICLDRHIRVRVNDGALALSKAVENALHILLGGSAQKALHAEGIIDVEDITIVSPRAVFSIAEGIGIDRNAHFVIAVHGNVGFLIAGRTCRPHAVYTEIFLDQIDSFALLTDQLRFCLIEILKVGVFIDHGVKGVSVCMRADLMVSKCLKHVLSAPQTKLLGQQADNAEITHDAFLMKHQRLTQNAVCRTARCKILGVKRKNNIGHCHFLL